MIERQGSLRKLKDQGAEDEKDVMVAPGTRIRAAPISATWDDAPRFAEDFRITWKRSEASNIVEPVTVCSCLKHVARDAKSWGLRLVVVPDNLAAIGVAVKGRSSKKRLLLLSRQLGALQLATGIRLVMRYTPSSRNWADGPSRGHGVGYYHAASKKMIKKAKRP